MSDTNQQTFLTAHVPISWTEWALPSPRHRNLQQVPVEGHAEVAIRTVPLAGSVLAFSVEDPMTGLITEYRAVGDELFVLGYLNESDEPEPVDEAWLQREGYALALANAGGAEHEVRKAMAAYGTDGIVIDGALWTKTLEPQYRTMTFGMGGAWGSVALTIESSHFFRENDETLFLADEYELAVAHGIAIATRRDDHESPERIRNAPTITVHDPSYIGSTMPRVNRMELPSVHNVELGEYVQVRAHYVNELRKAGALAVRDGLTVVDFDQLTDRQADRVRSMLAYAADVGLVG